MADREKKRGKDGNSKIWISENEKSSLDEKKIFSIVFEGLSFGEWNCFNWINCWIEV